MNTATKMESNSKSLAMRQDGSPVLASEIEQALIVGDLSKLRPEERVQLYLRTCESLHLNPLTRPFDYLILNGKLVLYAKKDATDQLRALYSVSVSLVSREKIDGVYVVTARATLPSGRQDESTGCVSLGKSTGDVLANLYMKAETKAKRRVTLSICGLGFLDESEVESIAGARLVPAEEAETKQVPAPLPALKSPPQASQGAPAAGESTTPPPAPLDPREVVLRKFVDSLKGTGWSKEVMKKFVQATFPKCEDVRLLSKLDLDTLQLKLHDCLAAAKPKPAPAPKAVEGFTAPAAVLGSKEDLEEAAAETVAVGQPTHGLVRNEPWVAPVGDGPIAIEEVPF